MENEVLYSNALFSIEITNRPSLKDTLNTDLIAFFQLEGVSDIRQKEQSWILHENDYLFVNPGQNYRYLILEHGMLAMIRIKAGNSVIAAQLSSSEFEVICNSFHEGDTGRSQMRRYLSSILHRALRTDREESALICSEFFLLLRLLRSTYCTPRRREGSKDLNTLERNARILSFLEENAAQKVTLDDLSKETFLSSVYLSRYIRKQFGQNFHDLLTDIRLKKAEASLQLRQASLTKISFDAGFPSVSAFTKAFTQKYGMNPSAYLNEKTAALSPDDPVETAAASASYSEDIQTQLQNYIAGHDIRLASSEQETIYIEGNAHDAQMFRRFWSRMINGGLARDFLRADMQEHMKILHDELGFSYIRIWDICAPDMMLYRQDREHDFNFTRLNNVLDFLVNIKVHPYIELGFKPVLLLKRADTPLVREERENIFQSSGEYAAFLQVMLRHFAARYGLPELETWYFEIWQDFRFQTTEKYFSEFDAIYSAIKAVSPKIRVGGPGFSGETPIPLEQTLRDWKKRHLYPDFVSVYSYPYESSAVPYPPEQKDAADSDSEVYRSMDSAYLRKMLDRFLGMLHENGFWHQEVLISEWNVSVSNRCVLHDSLYKGAYIVRNLISMINLADIAGYWFGSDLNSEFYDSQHLINGSAGLISKDGIRKPAFYGFEFFNRLADYLICHDENAVVTTNHHDSYSIVCHNMRELGYQYYQKHEDEVKPEEIARFFDEESRQFHFRIYGVRNGRYQIKRRVINSQYGSVQDEWMRMGLTDNLNLMDIDYLRRICVPHITIENHEVTDEILDFSVMLEPNAIENIHVYLLV